LRSDSLKPARKVYGDGGIGHFTALETLAGMAADMGACALAMSPVHAMFSADPGRSSPIRPPADSSSMPCWSTRPPSWAKRRKPWYWPKGGGDDRLP
jgi:hypothetical protein